MVPFRVFLFGSSKDCLDGGSVLGFLGLPVKYKKIFQKTVYNWNTVNKLINKPNVTNEDAMAIPV